MKLPSARSFLPQQLLPSGVAIVLTLGLASTASAAGFADVIFVVDESGSMGGEHAWLENTVLSLEAELNAIGVGSGTESNRYGLVGFGRLDRSNFPNFSHFQRQSYQVGGGLFGSSTDFVSTVDQLTTSGSIEDGYAGLDEALSYAFRPDASVNIILVTDEDRDNTDSTLNYSSILADFNANNALLNAVVNFGFTDSNDTTALGVDGNGNAYVADGNGGYITTPGGIAVSGYGTTQQDYVNLAWSTQSGSSVGAVWDLNQLRRGGLLADSFTQSFIDVKSREIQGQTTSSVPEPTSIFGTIVFSAIAGTLIKCQGDR